MKNYRLYLVRHGVTQGNLDGIYMGSGTDQPLCAQGAAQLRALAARFPYPKAETVFSSPMRRAVETVELLFPDAKDKIILADLRENAFAYVAEIAVFFFKLVFARDGFAPFREEYKAACVNLGRRVTFDLPDGGQGAGEAVDVDEEGRLVVRTDSGEVHVFTGEVSVHGIYGAV